MQSCLKYFFVMINLVLLCGGILAIGFTLWVQYASGVHEMLMDITDSSIVLYTMLAVGSLVGFTGFLGVIGACYEKKFLLGLYLGLAIFFLVGESALLAFAYLNQDALQQNIESLWQTLENDTKFLVQDRFNCCGYVNYSEWSGDFHQSCINVSVVNGTEPWTDSCYSNVSSWIDKNLIYLAAIAAFIMFFELFQIIVTSCLIHSIGKSGNKVEDREKLTADKKTARRESSLQVTEHHPDNTNYHNNAYEYE